MRKFLLCMLMLLVCGNVYASSQKVCVEVRSMSGYDSPGITDGWYDDVYQAVSGSLKKYDIDSENSRDVWRQFVHETVQTLGTADIGNKDPHELYAEFRKDRFDRILQFETTKYVNYKHKGYSDLAVTLTVKDPQNVDGKPLMVFKDSKSFPKGDVDLFSKLKVMTDGLIKRYVNH